MTAVDEVYVEQNKSGTVLKQIARVRVFFISFLSGKHKNSRAEFYFVLNLKFGMKFNNPIEITNSVLYKITI